MRRRGLSNTETIAAGRMSRMVWCAGLCAVLLAACSFPGTVNPTVKIGLSAPFEGLYRDLGYEALYAVQLAVRERNAGGGVGQRYLVELVALNDYNEADKAVEQARKMAVDGGILGVLGGWSQDTEAAAWQYDRLGLTFLTPGVDLIRSHSVVSADADFVARYAVQSGGASPGPAAIWAYSAANRLMDAVDASTVTDGCPTRSGVRRAVGSFGQ